MGGPAHVGIQERKRTARGAARVLARVARACTHAAISAWYAQAAHAAALELPFRVHSVCGIGRTDNGVEATGGKRTDNAGVGYRHERLARFR